MMFWRERERETKDQNTGVLCGQVRVLVVGDSGVGKTSLVHLIVKGSPVARPPQTIGCTVSVKHTTYGNSGSSSSSLKGDSERDFFIELWDVSGHERYKDCRSLFYSQINGVVFVHDLSQRRTKTNLQKWAAEIAATGTFSAPLGSGGPGGLPVPYIVIGNKADVAAKEGTRGSSGNLVDAARQWVEKQGLLPSRSSEELPLTESFPSAGGLIAAAKEARYDKEGVMKFFRMLIRRRYFSDEIPAPSPWSIPSVPRPAQRIDDDDQWSIPSVQRTAQRIDDDDQWSIPSVQRTAQRIDDSLIEEDMSYNTSLSSDPYKYKDTLPLLPAQRNLTPPPTLYPQQPVSVSETFSFPRFSLPGSSEISAAGRTKRSDINV